jgi:Tfp pilus assembly protein PilN
VSRPLNLARQPLRNERLPTLLLAAGCVALLGLSVHHAVSARNLLPERTAAVDGELVSLEKERAQLQRESAELKGRSASPDHLEEWDAVRGLVDHRTFSWSALFGSLERVMPPDVRLVSVVPGGGEGAISLELRAVGRDVAAGHAFLEVLQESQEFREPFLESVGETDDGVEFDFTVGYVPERTATEEGS